MRKFTWLLALAIPVTIISCQKDAVQEEASDDVLVQVAGQETGNGSPSGAHFTLNIIGVPKGKTATADETDQSNGHRIFIPLNTQEGTNAKILLSPGDDFKVVDYNGTDGEASFQLPWIDPDGNYQSNYSVWARALGKPGGNIVMTTCATVVESENDLIPAGTEVCNTDNILDMTRTKAGAPKFENVSKDLLYVWVDLDGDGRDEAYPLFSDELEDYYWSVDNNGLKLLQLRFYHITDTTVDPR